MNTTHTSQMSPGILDSGWLTSSICLVAVIIISELCFTFKIPVDYSVIITLLAVSLLLTVCYAGYAANLLAVGTFTVVASLYFAYYLFRLSSTMAAMENSIAMTFAAGLAFLITGTAINFLQRNNEQLVERERLAASQARAEQLRLVAILEQLPVGVIVADSLTGKTLYSNQEIVNLTGRPFNSNRPHFYAKKRAFTKDKQPIPSQQWPLARVLRGEIVTQEQMFYRRDDDSYVPLSINGAPIHDQFGHQIAGVVIMANMSRNNEDELRKDEFISIASHELKSPVTSLKVYSELLAKQIGHTKNSRPQQILAKMDSQLNKLTHLANDLLDISRIQSGKLTYRVATFDAKACIQDVVEGLDHSTHHIIIDGAITRPVIGDPERIGQVVINLLTNAMKYSPRDSQIIVRLAEEPDRAIISIQDFGIGIKSSDQPKIFSQFYQVSSQQTTSPGLGIGLYLASQIIRYHHGNIWLDSQLGHGSTFYFSLPLGLNEPLAKA